MSQSSQPRRVLSVNASLEPGGAPPRRALVVRRRGDFPRCSAAHLDVAEKLASPLLMGPPLCDELIALVEHVFTEDEARLARHIRLLRGSTAARIAAIEGRGVDDVIAALDRLAVDRRALGASGSGPKRKYAWMPIMPGMFEMVLIGESLEALSPWHRRFAQLFEALYDTGYIAVYQDGRTRPVPVARAIPIGRSIEAHPMAIPSDRLDVVLERYSDFGVGQCQCRMTAASVGKGCGRPLGNCVAMGEWARAGIAGGWLKRASRADVLEVKREAESQGLLTWMMNVESSRGQASCSCCGCCCHALRMVHDFNAPGVIAPAHFLPEFADAACTWCGRCQRMCPLGALEIDAKQKRRTWRRERCLGCGVCVAACGDRKAIAMQPVPGYKLPYRSWFAMIAGLAPSALRGALTAWRSR